MNVPLRVYLAFLKLILAALACVLIVDWTHGLMSAYDRTRQTIFVWLAVLLLLVWSYFFSSSAHWWK